MANRANALDNLHNDRKKQIVFFIVCEILILFCYFIGSIGTKKAGKLEMVKASKVVKDYNLLGGLESINRGTGIIELSGWIETAYDKNTEFAIVLKEIEGTEEHIVFCKVQERNNAYNDDFFYQEGNGKLGFSATIKEKLLKKESPYEIEVFYSRKTNGDGISIEEKKRIRTSWVCFSGEIYSYNPKGFVTPEISDAEIMQILNEGIIKAYDEKEKIWVYQYSGKLYYIVDSRKNSIHSEEPLRIPVMPRTPRPELLRPERQKDGSDHLGAYYEDQGYCRDGISPYQIVVIEIPKGYPISYIVTGLYNNSDKEWIKELIIPIYAW